MIYGIVFFAVYFGIGLLLALLLGFHSSNLGNTKIMIWAWPLIIYWGIYWNVVTNRVNQLGINDVEEFYKLMKIVQIEKARNRVAMCFIYTVTFQNGKVKRYTIFDKEIVSAIMNRDNGVFYVMAVKILHNERVEG